MLVQLERINLSGTCFICINLSFLALCVFTHLVCLQATCSMYTEEPEKWEWKLVNNRSFLFSYVFAFKELKQYRKQIFHTRLLYTIICVIDCPISARLLLMQAYISRVLQYTLKVVNHFHQQGGSSADAAQKWKQLEGSLSSFRKCEYSFITAWAWITWMCIWDARNSS